MSYQVIARKYRPQRFSDVVGQGHVIQTLKNAVAQERIAHAYLFSGPRGTGKTTIARIFAKCLNCTDGPKVDFPEDDERCIEIAEGRSLDVIEIDGASNRGIEEIRELRDTVRYAPTNGRFKIYIIDEVHMLTKEAFNALLKTLEEPPEHAKFMFATTEPEKVLATILSRCQRFDLRRIPAAEIVGHLADISVREGVKIDDAALYAIARGADGGMRDAESTLDQLISFCGDTIAEDNVLSMFGLAARAEILDLAGAILNGDENKVLRSVGELASGGKDLGRLLSDLLNHFRNLLVYAVSGGDTTLLEISEAEASALAEQGGLADQAALTRIMESLTDSELRLRNAASKRIALEVALLKAVQACRAVSVDTLIRKLRALKDGLPSEPAATRQSQPAPAAPPTQRAAPAPPPRAPEPPAPAPAPAAMKEEPAPQGAPPADHSTLWTRLIEQVGAKSKFVRTYLLEAHLESFERGVLQIGFDPSVSDKLGLVNNEKNIGLISGILESMGHKDARVRFCEAPRPEGWTAPTIAEEPPKRRPQAREREAIAEEKPAAAAPPEPIIMDPEEFKNDPAIKRALEVFKGEIVKIHPGQ